MENVIGHRTRAQGLCRFYSCSFCGFTVCKRFILPHVLIDQERFPICKSMYWYRGPPLFKESNTCKCEVLSCSRCGHCLCTCTIESLNGCCPWCNEEDKWVIISPEFFSVSFG